LVYYHAVALRAYRRALSAWSTPDDVGRGYHAGPVFYRQM